MSKKKLKVVMAAEGTELTVQQRFNNAIAKATHEAAWGDYAQEIIWRPDMGRSGLFLIARAGSYSPRRVFVFVQPSGSLEYGEAYSEGLLRDGVKNA